MLRTRSPTRSIAYLLVCAFAGAGLAAAEAPSDTIAARLFIEDAAQQCGGRYVEPMPRRASELDDGKAIAYADAIDYDQDGRSVLVGDVEVLFGGRRLIADSAVLDGNEVELTGRPRFSEPGVHIEGHSIDANVEQERASIYDAIFLMSPSEYRGTAKRIDVAGDALVLNETALTACRPGRRGWRVVASEIEYEEEAVYAKARRARVELFGVPVIYIPSLRFPVSSERTSGFLFPSAEQSGRDGTDIGIPYYLNLAPNMDATVAPRWISQRGPGLEAEWRYLTRNTRWDVSGAYLNEDERYNGLVDRDDYTGTSPFDPADRWLARVSQRGRWGGLSTRIDFAAASDNDYFLDLGSGLGIISQHALERRGEVSYRRGGFDATLWAQRFQRLESRADPYRREPELVLSYTRFLAPVDLSLRSSVGWFDSSLSGVVTGRRAHVEPGIRLEIDRPGVWFESDARLYHTAYELDTFEPLADDQPNRTLHGVAVGTGLRFERKGKGQRVQTLEPAIRYRYRSFEDQAALPLFDTGAHRPSFDALMRDRRYLGLDRIADRNEVVVSLQSRWFDPLMPARSTALRAAWIDSLEPARVTVFDDELDFDRLLIVGGEWRRSFGDARFRQTVDAVWNEADAAWDEVALASRLSIADRLILNAGIRRRPRDDVRQTDVGFAWQLNHALEVVGRWNFDWQTDRTLESLAGLSYADCCFAVSFLWFKNAEARRNVSPLIVRAREGLMFQFEFRGLGGVGTRLRSRIARGIRGYDDARDVWGGEIFDEE